MLVVVDLDQERLSSMGDVGPLLNGSATHSRCARPRARAPRGAARAHETEHRALQ